MMFGVLGVSPVWAVLSGVDSGFSARELVRTTEAAVLKRWGEARPWIRIRGLPDPSDAKRAADVGAERDALGQLKEWGFKPVPFIRWASASWVGGVRNGGGQRLPLDLHEAYERAKRITETYGAVVTGFEFENEPDINFVEENAETYAAFQKACYLGVRAADAGAELDWWGTLARANGGLPVPVVNPGRRPLAIMAPLALPPGPFFERLRENGLFAYTDAFNYHYYGHADDFTRVYRQFEDAVATEAKADQATSEPLKPEPAVRRLPVMLTEYGFSGVSGPERYGAEVRVEQWRWFRTVGEQIGRLKIAAPMAFYLRPYYERKQIEFGLTVAPGEAAKAGRLTAGGLAFRAADFGVEQAEPWMERIGARVGGNEALPALAWLWDAGERANYRPRDWAIEVPEGSPVVLDVVAAAGLAQLKRYNGYMITGADEGGEAPRGNGELAIYNFSNREIRGTLRWETDADTTIAWSGEMASLPPMGRLTVPFSVASASSVFAGSDVKAIFEAGDVATAAAVLATKVYPSTTGMSAQVLERFDHGPEAAEKNREWLEGRPRASDERALAAAGRWMTSPHARAEELPKGRWRLVGTEFRLGPKVGRATLELPLRDDFVFPEQSALRLSHRLAEAAGLDEGAERELFLEVYFRTANGNLFVVWPWARVQTSWNAYLELRDNYTMMFQSRANLPWRFAENRPVSLVFSFYSPTMEGAVVEIDRAEIVRIGK